VTTSANIFSTFRNERAQRWDHALQVIRAVVHVTHAGLILLALLIVSEEALPTSVQLSVSATVLKKAWVRMTPPPAAFEVTEEDIARGYIDAPQATIVNLRSNSDDGFVFHFQIDAGVVSAVSVVGLQQPVTIGPAGATAILPGRFKTEQQVALRWRLRLAPQVPAGTKSWPVQMDISVN
jgi:hypothetical protein